MTANGKTASQSEDETVRENPGPSSAFALPSHPAHLQTDEEGALLSTLRPVLDSQQAGGPKEASAIDLGARGQVVIVPDGSALARAAAERFASTVEQAIAERGQATVALSGGTTPRQMGGILAREPYRSRIPWSHVHVFWGDERWVPLGSPESNAGEAKRGFLDLVPIPVANVHPWNTEGESPQEAAASYELLLRQMFNMPSEFPRFDLVLLGMGDDGHTASLFPNTRALGDVEHLAVANYVPKMDTTRLTLTAPVLRAGREVLFLAGGPGKADTLQAVLEGPDLPATLPAQLIRPTLPDSRLYWIVDEDAGAKLHRRDT